MGLGLSLLSYNHFTEEPAAASTFAIMSNPHSVDLPDRYCFNYKLIQLDIQETNRLSNSILTRRAEFKNTKHVRLKMKMDQRLGKTHQDLQSDHCGESPNQSDIG